MCFICEFIVWYIVKWLNIKEFDDTESADDLASDDLKEEKLEKSIDKIRDKYGYRSIKRGVVLQNDLTGNLHEEDDFRPFHQSKST